MKKMISLTPTMHSLKRTIGLLIMSGLISACATSSQTEISETDSGLEKFNKASYNVTDVADVYFLKPIAKGYSAVLPDPVEDAFGRMFENAREVRTVANDLLQGKFGQAGTGTGRVLLNSTLGIIGLFEVAESFGLEKNEPEDFGQTLAAWGVGSGPYLYIPFLGPSTLRDAPSRFVDYWFNPISHIDGSNDRYLLTGWDLLQQRASLLEIEGIATGDRYLFLKDTYLQRREYLINDGQLSEELDDFDTDF